MDYEIRLAPAARIDRKHTVLKSFYSRLSHVEEKRDPQHKLLHVERSMIRGSIVPEEVSGTWSIYNRRQFYRPTTSTGLDRVIERCILQRPDKTEDGISQWERLGGHVPVLNRASMACVGYCSVHEEARIGQDNNTLAQCQILISIIGRLSC